jgi:hypothetical protein
VYYFFLKELKLFFVFRRVHNLCYHYAETRSAIAELRAGKGKRFSSIDDLMADLHDENDA